MNSTNAPGFFEPESEPEMVFFLDLEDDQDTEPGIHVDLLAGDAAERFSNPEAL